MVDDKWIGLALAFSSSLAIGMSAVITKKGLNASADSSFSNGGQQASDNYIYLKNPIWWAGMSTLIIGEIANFAAYTFAPPILVTPLGGLSVLVGAVLASFLLHEELGHLGRLGCTLSLIGSLIIVLHAPEDKPIDTVDQILEYAIHPGFMLYVFTVTVFSLTMIYAVVPRHGRTNPLVYVSICSLVGSVSVMAIKGFGVAVKLTFAGKNQFLRPSTYVFGLVTAFCILVQMNYYNKALDTFSVNIVNSMYYVGFSTAVIVASLILFQGFNTHDATNTLSLLAGFIVTFLGVHILNLSRLPEPPLDTHTTLEGGLMNPRLSLQGRTSIDAPNGYGPVDGSPHGISSHYTFPRTPRTPRSAGHQQRGSGSGAYRPSALSQPPNGMGNGNVVGLQRLDELEDTTDDDEDADERTRLHSSRPQNHSRQGSRSGTPSRSPLPAGSVR